MVRAVNRTAIIVNPRSSGGQTSFRWTRLRETIVSQFGPFDVYFTEKAGHGIELTRRAIAAGAGLVVALGGDGTINEVVNGFWDADGNLASNVELGILPAGTGGDFIKTAGIPRHIEDACKTLKTAAARPFDIGRITFTDHQGQTVSRYFINIASFGIAGLVDRLVDSSGKRLGGRVAFAVATVRAGVSYKNANVEMVIDGQTRRSGKIYNIAVANGRYFGGGMKVAPDADPNDGWFDVVTLGDFGLRQLLMYGPDIYSGNHLRHPEVSVVRARHVEARSTDGSTVWIDVDGEQPGCLPATFEMIPGAIQLRA